MVGTVGTVGWVDPGHPVLSSATALARELADPIRLTALQLLTTEGPHTMTQLAEALGVSAPRLANHLARLRAAGLVTVEHQGRHAVYRAAGGGLGDVLAALSRYAHAEGDRLPSDRRPSPADIAHTCYDHAAGRLGVAVFAALVERNALLPPDGRENELTLGPNRTPFLELGVDPDRVDAPRRKLATACLDRTHRLPHLGGALGQAILDAFLAKDLVRRDDGNRALLVTTKGATEFPHLLPGFTPHPNP